MRTTILTGLLLAVAAIAMMLLGDALDLGLEAVGLMGAALGAVLALVPDATTGRRIGTFVAGFAVALVGYVARAAVLPDSTSGRAVAVGVVILVCTGVTALSVGKLPLWGVLLGAAGMAGAYEYPYTAAPPRVLDTSVSTSTAMLLSVALGFVVALLMMPKPDRERTEAQHVRNDDQGDDALDNMMEKAK